MKTTEQLVNEAIEALKADPEMALCFESRKEVTEWLVDHVFQGLTDDGGWQEAVKARDIRAGVRARMDEIWRICQEA